MIDINNMSKKISKLYKEEFEKRKEIATEKIRMILELARENENIPNFLELEEDEIAIIEDILTDKAFEKDKNKEELYKENGDGTISIKIGDILLTLGGHRSYYMTKEDFEQFYKETQEEGGSLDNFAYLNVQSLCEAEFFELFERNEDDKKQRSDNETEVPPKGEVDKNLPVKQKAKITFQSIKRSIAKAFNKGER